MIDTGTASQQTWLRSDVWFTGSRYEQRVRHVLSTEAFTISLITHSTATKSISKQTFLQRQWSRFNLALVGHHLLPGGASKVDGQRVSLVPLQPAPLVLSSATTGDSTNFSAADTTVPTRLALSFQKKLSAASE